jgi:flagellar basal body-associated protein FliL
MKKKLIIGLLVILAIGGYVAKSMLLKPKVVVPKIDGSIYVLPHAFTLNMADGRYATLTAALLLAPGQSDGSSATGAAPSSDATVGTLPEEAAIRDIITNTITSQPGSELTSIVGREHLKREILHEIRTGTDDKVDGVYFTDVAVQ